MILQPLTLKVNNWNRSYLLGVPTQPNPSPGIIFAFHPFTFSAEKFASIIDFADLAEKNGYILVFPKGRLRSWFSVFGHRQADIDFYDALCQEMFNLFPINKQKLILLGWSDGGYMANYLAHVRSCAGVVSYNASLSDFNLHMSTPCPAMVIHGKDDKLVKIGEAVALREHYKSEGCSVSYYISNSNHMWSTDDNSAIWNFILKCS